MSKPKKAAPQVRAPGAGRKAGTSKPIMQVRPVIKKRQMRTMVGRDLMIGHSAFPLQKGVQCQIRQYNVLSDEGTITSPTIARTIANYETTANNAFIRESLATPDMIYDALMAHPARQRVVKSTRGGKITERIIPGKFVLTPHIPEMTEEEEVMALEGSNGGFEGEMPIERSTTSISASGIPQDFLDKEPQAQPIGKQKSVKETTVVEVEEDIVV